jgi:alpha-1,6-mannosyltransferase
LRYLGGHYDVTVCANRSLAERLRQGGVRGVAVHPLGIEAETFSPNLRDEALRRTLLSACGLDGNARLLVAAGRLAPEKRWPMVVEAVAAASRRVPVGLVLFGEGRERRAIQRAIGGNPHVRLFEPIRDRKAFAATLASADALIHGCEAETFCMVAAEARASGTPVIVPDRGGAAEHARDGAGMRYEAASVHAASDAIAAFCLERRSGLSIGSTASHVAGDVISHTDHFARLFAHYEMLGRMRAAA